MVADPFIFLYHFLTKPNDTIPNPDTEVIRPRCHLMMQSPLPKIEATEMSPDDRGPTEIHASVIDTTQ